MKNFKQYENLYGLYRSSINKRLITLLILLIVFVLSVIATIADVFFDATMVLVVISFFLSIIFGIICLTIRIMTSKSLSRFTSEELARIDSQIPFIKMQERIGVTQDAVICYGNGPLILFRVKDVLWIYKEVTTTRLYGLVPIYKFSSVYIVDRYRKRHSFLTKNKTEIVAFLQEELQKYRKGIFYGYSQDLSSLYCNDFDRMLSISDEYEKQAR